MQKHEFLVAMVVVGIGIVVLLMLVAVGAGIGGLGLQHSSGGCVGVPFNQCPTPPPTENVKLETGAHIRD